MDHYYFTARSVTHAQQMARELERSGIFVKIRRVGSGVTKSGCGYTIDVPERKYRQALEALREAGLQPVRVLLVSGGTVREVGI